MFAGGHGQSQTHLGTVDSTEIIPNSTLGTVIHSHSQAQMAAECAAPAPDSLVMGHFGHGRRRLARSWSVPSRSRLRPVRQGHWEPYWEVEHDRRCGGGGRASRRVSCPDVWIGIRQGAFSDGQFDTCLVTVAIAQVIDRATWCVSPGVRSLRMLGPMLS